MSSKTGKKTPFFVVLGDKTPKSFITNW